MIETTVDIMRPWELPGDVRAAWRAWTREIPGYANPLLSAGFADVMGAVRSDVAVAVYRQQGRVVGVWPHHRCPNRFARPLGGPFADIQAVLIEPGFCLSPVDALRLAGRDAFRFTALYDPDDRFAEHRVARVDGRVVDLSDGHSAYAAAQKAAHAKSWSNLARSLRKAERDYGDVTYTPGDRDPEAFAWLMTTKRAQFARTGRHDVLAPDWAGRMIDLLWAAPGDGEVCGRLSTLRIGGRIAAADFSIYSGAVMNSWLLAFAPEFSRVSPGMLLVERVIAAAATRGVQRVEMGPGDDRHKTTFANDVRPLDEGFVATPSFRGATEAAIDGAWRLAEAAPAATVARFAGRARRRLEQIAAAEPSLAGRTRGVVQAFARPKG